MRINKQITIPIFRLLSETRELKVSNTRCVFPEHCTYWKPRFDSQYAYNIQHIGIVVEHDISIRKGLFFINGVTQYIQTSLCSTHSLVYLIFHALTYDFGHAAWCAFKHTVTYDFVAAAWVPIQCDSIQCFLCERDRVKFSYLLFCLVVTQ